MCHILRMNIWINLSIERSFDGITTGTGIREGMLQIGSHRKKYYPENWTAMQRSVEYTERKRRALLVSCILRFQLRQPWNAWENRCSNDYTNANDSKPHKRRNFFFLFLFLSRLSIDNRLVFYQINGDVLLCKSYATATNAMFNWWGCILGEKSCCTIHLYVF